METKHTKGKWEADKADLNNDFLIWDTQLENDIPKLIARVQYEDVTDEEQEANAKLIATAPELLEVLIEVEKWASEFGMGSIQYEKVINAINKATGK